MSATFSSAKGSRRRNAAAKTRSETGQATFELAIIAPVLFALLIGLIEVGRFAHFAIVVGNAAHAGVQYGGQSLVTALDYAGMQSAALNDAQNIAGLTATATSYCKCADGSASTCQSTVCSTSHRMVYVQVTVSGTFESLFKYPGLPQSLSVTRQAIVPVAP
jgi:Flp pilus assembly protein TadG